MPVVARSDAHACAAPVDNSGLNGMLQLPSELHAGSFECINTAGSLTVLYIANQITVALAAATPSTCLHVQPAYDAQ